MTLYSGLFADSGARASGVAFGGPRNLALSVIWEANNAMLTPLFLFVSWLVWLRLTIRVWMISSVRGPYGGKPFLHKQQELQQHQ